MSRLDVSEASVELAAVNAHSRWQTRRSARVKLVTDGFIGLGEAAPLPGYSAETLDEAIQCLRSLSTANLNLFCQAAAPAELLARLDAELVRFPPSARFAIEMAAFDVLGQRLGVPAWRLFCTGGLSSEDPPLEPPSCRLFSVWEPDYEAAFDALLASGVGCLKVKVGRDPLQEARRLTTLLRRAPTALVLRLDANRNLKGQGWLDQLAPLLSLQPEFVEEPCPIRELGAPRPLGFPLAFDEALTDPEEGVSAIVDSWLECRAVRVLVLKPMLVGSFNRSVAIAARAAAHGAEVVVSHVFDGSIAAAAYRHLSVALGSRCFASGLGEHPGLRLWADNTSGAQNPSGLGLFAGEPEGFRA
jgi:L-Ala-D/L-Glu epimerase